MSAPELCQDQPRSSRSGNHCNRSSVLLLLCCSCNVLAHPSAYSKMDLAAVWLCMRRLLHVCVLPMSTYLYAKTLVCPPVCICAVYGEIEFDAGHWGVFENAIDMAHIHYLHADSFGNAEKPKVMEMQSHRDTWETTCNFRYGKVGHWVSSMGCLQPWDCSKCDRLSHRWYCQ